MTASSPGLGGELRPVMHLERRVLEALKMGFTTCIVPASGSKLNKKRLEGMTVRHEKDIRSALRASIGLRGARNNE